MEYLSIFAFILLFFIAPTWFVIQAFRISIGWGLATILIQVTNIFLLFKYWKTMRQPFFLGIIGLSLFIFSIIGEDYVNMKFYKKEPLEIQLTELLNGTLPDNYHIKLREHYRAYSNFFYYEDEKNKDNLSTIYYPVFENEKSLSYSNERIVFIETKDIESKKELPEDHLYLSLSGLISKDSNKKIKDYITANYKNINSERIIIIEEGNKPPTKQTIYTFLLISGLTCLLFSFFLIRSFKQNNAENSALYNING